VIHRLTSILSISLAVVVALSLGLMFLAPTTVNSATTGDYLCNTITISQGKLASGSAASLNTKDNVNLTIQSSASSGYYCLDWYSEFTLPSNRVTSLNLSYVGRYSTWRGQNILLFDFTTSSWKTLDYRTVGASTLSINLTSIPSPAKYVSANGQVRVRLYTYSTASYVAYTDYVKIGATFQADAPSPTITPTTTPTATPTITPTPTPTTTPTPTFGSTPMVIVVDAGTTISGNQSSLLYKDSSNLTIAAKTSGGNYAVDWTAKITLPSNQVKTLSLSYQGRYSTWRGQNILLYDFVSATWKTLDYRTVGASIASIELTSIAGPYRYVSPNGQVWVRFYSYSTSSYTAYTDYLKVQASY
jgi:hypothetical protein